MASSFLPACCWQHCSNACWQHEFYCGGHEVDGGAGEVGNLLLLAISKASKCTKMPPLPE
jgi:hypothetical protein